MTMTPRLRRFALAAHVASSVGWVGAVVVFLALAVVGLTSQDAQTVRGAYLVMEPAARYVLVPLAFASLLTGLVQSQTLSSLANVAAETTLSGDDLGVLRSASPALHAGAALLLLLVATTLAVFKPPGLTPYGQRKQHEQRMATQR